MRRLADAPPADAILSEEGRDAEDPAGTARLAAERVWIVDPLDGTREYGEPPRADWAVHVALVIGGAAGRRRGRPARAAAACCRRRPPLARRPRRRPARASS